VALLAFGSMVAPALGAAEALNATVINMRFIKPLDLDTLAWAANHHDLLVTIEENVIAGGAGSGCAEALVAMEDRIPMIPIMHLGLPDRFIDQGDHAKLLSLEGLDAAGIEASVRRHAAQVQSKTPSATGQSEDSAGKPGPVSLTLAS
jgi:1-deoxy-D-xylulose-5-phosphate synthase